MGGTSSEFRQAAELSRRLAPLLGGEWQNIHIEDTRYKSVYKWTRSNSSGRVALFATYRKDEGGTWDVLVTANSYDSVPSLVIDIWQDSLTNLDSFILPAAQAAAIRAIMEKE